jgi:hypothetical protein
MWRPFAMELYNENYIHKNDELEQILNHI